MKKQIIIWAAVLAALFVVTALIIWFVPNFMHNQKTEITPVATAAQVTPEPTTNPPVIPEQTVPAPAIEPTVTENPIPAPKTTNNTSKRNSEEAFKLNIKGKMVSIAYGVDEATLDRTPGWLTTSASPGQHGTCVVYGHRNRTHLRALEKVEIGDSIAVISGEESFSYTVQSIRILENSEALTIPVMEGKNLMLVTCYPFRYSGRAPKKCVIIGTVI